MPTTPTSIVNRLMGVEAFTDSLTLTGGFSASGTVILPAGTVVGTSNLGSGVVNTTATSLAVTAALHAGKTITVSSTAANAITLPAATGTGNHYRFVVLVAATGTAHTISVSATAESMTGLTITLTTSSDNMIGYHTTATDNRISLDGTTKGGVVGDIIELTDVGTSTWSVRITGKATGSTATPFSHF